MAIDSITCYINNIKPIEKGLFLSDPYHWIPDENNSNEYLYSRYHHTTDGIFLRYKPFSEKGTLSIKFNVSKLVAGDNIASIFSYNIQTIFDILKEYLVDVVDLDIAPHLRFWKVSRVENNINIIRPSDIINSLYSLIAKISKTKSYNFHSIYEDMGTIYFSNGKELNRSTSVTKFYLKLKEIQAKDPGKTLSSYLASDLINLMPNDDVLRVELVMGRREINQMFKPKILFSSNDIYLARDITIRRSIGTFEQIMNYDFQLLILNDILNEFHLDKTMTTKDNLFNLINMSTDLSPKKKQTAKSVINYLNLKDNYHKNIPSTSTIYRYKQWILDQGYHFLYSDQDIAPIKINEIIMQLPDHQQDSIAQFSYSDIYKDLLY